MPSMARTPIPTPIPALAPGFSSELELCEAMGGTGNEAVEAMVVDGGEQDVVELPNGTPMNGARENAYSLGNKERSLDCQYT